jgi:DNA-binding MarR family transcriptional regulator
VTSTESTRHYMRKTAASEPPRCGYPDALIACPDFLLGRVAVTVADLIEEALAPLGLRLRHYRLLRFLWLDGPHQQSALGVALQVDRTTVVALVDLLEQHKLAKRERDRDDRRVFLVRLTAKGEEVAHKATDIATAVSEKIFAPLEKAERQLLRALFVRLLTSPGPIADAHARIAEPDKPAPSASQAPDRSVARRRGDTGRSSRAALAESG